MSVLLRSAFTEGEGARRRTVIVAALVAAAWAALALWSLSPYAEWLDHSHMDHLPASLPVRMLVFTLGWTLMVVAMMVPSMLLLVAHEPGAGRAGPMVAAYLGVWALFGGLCYVADNILHDLSHDAPELARAVAPTLLFVAGVYQFTPIKRASLARCRLDGARPSASGSVARNPWLVGVRHGVDCLASCWALMLLMMALGGASLLGMAILTAMVAVERLARRGVEWAHAIGFLLLLSSLLLAIL